MPYIIIDYWILRIFKKILWSTPKEQLHPIRPDLSAIMQEPDSDGEDFVVGLVQITGYVCMCVCPSRSKNSEAIF